MHNRIFPKLAVRAKKSKGLLGPYFDCFVSWMQKNGYSPISIRSNIRDVICFGEYLYRRGIYSIHQLEGVVGQKLLTAYKQYRKYHRDSIHRISGISHFLQALKDANLLINLPSQDLLLLPEIKQYIDFLRNQKGFSEITIQSHKYWIEKFLTFVGYVKGTSSMPLFGIANVDKFIKQESIRVKYNTPTWVLRSFSRFLYQSGKLHTDLSCLITSPCYYKLQSLPKVISNSEIQNILDNVDQSTKMGIRDYTIIILLATYGLRAGEISKLKLEDIDWRKESIHITQRKMRRDLFLPLIPQVGKAILKYLKLTRPHSKYREIFIITTAPWSPLNRTSISRIATYYIKLAGLELPRYGAHLFRHSLATNLIRRSASLKQIGDILGHRSPISTHIYTKTATEQLQDVALEVPEEVKRWATR